MRLSRIPLKGEGVVASQRTPLSARGPTVLESWSLWAWPCPAQPLAEGHRCFLVFLGNGSAILSQPRSEEKRRWRREAEAVCPEPVGRGMVE